MRIEIAAGAGGLDQEILEIPILSFAQCRVDAHIGGAARKQQMRDAAGPQNKLEIGVGEGAIRGLVDDNVARTDVDLRYDLEARRGAQQDVGALEAGAPPSPQSI